MAPKIHLIAAARPNFMKIAPMWHAMSNADCPLEPILIHTGQHYDKNMSDVFFEDLGLPRPHHHLGIGSGSHAQQTAGVMLAYEKLALEDRPDLVLVVGDVNATMAVTVTASKLHIPVAHVEAGLRSQDMRMPEEINRLMTDAVADLLLTPSRDADENLRNEGVRPERIRFVGNIMIDSLVRNQAKAMAEETHARMGLEKGGYGVVTLHRPGNVDDPASLTRILQVLTRVERPLLFPVHPRTRVVMEKHGLIESCGLGQSNLRLIDPLGYYEFMNLIMNAQFILTDSGGIQEETTYLGIPCLTLRPNTERPITITEGTNELATVESLPGQIGAILAGKWKNGRVPEYWDGKTAVRIVEVLKEFLGCG